MAFILPLLAADIASATPAQFDNLSDFLAGVDTIRAVETFEELSGSYTAPIYLDAGGFTFYAGTGSGFLVGGSAGNHFLQNMTSTYATQFGLDSPVQAIGGTFWNATGSGAPVSGDVTIEIPGVGSFTIPSAGPGTFFGYISDQPITQFTVLPTPGNYIAVGDLYFADVPEPGTVLAALAGLGVFAFVRRRRFARP